MGGQTENGNRCVKEGKRRVSDFTNASVLVCLDQARDVETGSIRGIVLT